VFDYGVSTNYYGNLSEAIVDDTRYELSLFIWIFIYIYA